MIVLWRKFPTKYIATVAASEANKLSHQLLSFPGKLLGPSTKQTIVIYSVLKSHLSSYRANGKFPMMLPKHPPRIFFSGHQGSIKPLKKDFAPSVSWPSIINTYAHVNSRRINWEADLAWDMTEMLYFVYPIIEELILPQIKLSRDAPWAGGSDRSR